MLGVDGGYHHILISQNHLDRKNAFNIRTESSYVDYASLQLHSFALCPKKKETQTNKQTVNKPLVKLTLLTHAGKNTACTPPVKLFLAGTMLNTWHLVVEIWLPLMPNLSGEHQGCCVLAMAKRAFLRFIELHYEGMNCYKFSAWNKARLMAATLYTTRSNLPLVLPVCTLPRLCVITNVHHHSAALHSLSLEGWGGSLLTKPGFMCVCPQNLPLTLFSTPTHPRSHPPHHQVHSTMMPLL